MRYPFEADDKVDIQLILLDPPGILYEETVPFLPYPFDFLSGMNSYSHRKPIESTHCTCAG